MVKKVLGDDCGCDKRKNWLNERFPRYEPMTATQKATWEKHMAEVVSGNFEAGSQTELNRLYNEVFHARAKNTRCGSCFKRRLLALGRVYELCQD